MGIEMISLTEMLRFDIDETNLPVRREQVRARIAVYPTMILPAMLMAPLLVWVMWDAVAHELLLGWMVMTFITQLFELSQWWRLPVIHTGCGAMPALGCAFQTEYQHRCAGVG